MTIPAANLPNTYLVRLEGSFIGEPCANVIAVADGVSPSTAGEIAARFGAALDTTLSSATGTAYRAVVSNGRTYENLHVVQYDAANPTVADEALVGANKTGTSAGHALPPQIAIVISLTTGLASRRRRGRLYDYGFTESNNDGTGRIDATARSAVENFWALLGTNLLAEDLVWVVLSRGWVNEGPGDTRESYAQSASIITNWAVRDTKWDTMRSRVPS